MTDKAHKATDKQIEAMERHIDKIYREAENGVIQKADAYFKQFERLDKKKAEQVAKGLLSEEEYLKWRKNKMLYGKRFDNMKKQIAVELARTNETALAYINGELPKTYIANYNAVNEGIQDTVDGYSFELVDKNTVKKIATEGDKSLLPPPSQKTLAKIEKSLSEGKDIRWNTKKINAEVLQGVLQGESMDKIAKRMRNVTDMNKTSAVRNARTMVTGAENAGRMDMLHKATSDGIQVQKEWIAAIDRRTRHWHANLDGELKDIDEPFENVIWLNKKGTRKEDDKIMFPGDPSAHPANVYNCRCSLGTKVIGFGKTHGHERDEVQEKITALKNELEGIPVEKKIITLTDKSTGKYIGKNVNGQAFGLVDDVSNALQDKKDVQKALSSTKFMKKQNIIPQEKEATITTFKPLSFAKRKEIEDKIAALQSGYGDDVLSFKLLKEEKAKSKLQGAVKTAKESFWSSVARKDLPAFYADSEGVYYNSTSAIELFSRYAKKFGAEEIHTSATSGSKFSSSVYLKIDGYELRVSDHYLPDTLERRERGGFRWNDEFVFDDAGFAEMAAIKTEEEFKKWILSKFGK